MKRLIIITISTIYLLGMINVYADNITVSETKATLIQLNILDESGFSNPDAITREECLIAIMRVIGVTDEEINSIGGTSLYAFADTNSRSYFGCAWLGKIAYGEECVVDYPTERTSHTLKNTDFFFFPERAVTVKETLAFMVRCLERDKIDLNTTFQKAKEYGLINDEDEFITDTTINQEEFCVLIERLLQQKRYKYYGRENDRFKMEGNIDEYRSISYLDMLNQM